MIRRLCLVGLLLATAACAVSNNSDELPSAVIVELRYEANMRPPESWSAQIFENGRAVFRTDRISDGAAKTFERQLSNGTILSIREAFAEEQFSSLDARYAASATDQETLTISWVEGGKTVSLYGPQLLCGEPGPASFLRLWRSVAAKARVPHSLKPKADYSQCAANLAAARDASRVLLSRESYTSSRRGSRA